MPNITLAIDEKLLKDGREYAKKNGVSFNSLVRSLIEREVTPVESGGLEEFFALADEMNINSGGITWTREELYRV